MLLDWLLHGHVGRDLVRLLVAQDKVAASVCASGALVNGDVGRLVIYLLLGFDLVAWTVAKLKIVCTQVHRLLATDFFSVVARGRTHSTSLPVAPRLRRLVIIRDTNVPQLNIVESGG